MSLHGKSMGSITDLAGTDQLDSPKLYPKLVERGFSALDHHVTNSIVLVHAGSQTFCLLGNLDEGDKWATRSPRRPSRMVAACRRAADRSAKRWENMDNAPPTTTPTSEVTVTQIELTMFL